MRIQRRCPHYSGVRRAKRIAPRHDGSHTADFISEEVAGYSVPNFGHYNFTNAFGITGDLYSGNGSNQAIGDGNPTYMYINNNNGNVADVDPNSRPGAGGSSFTINWHQCN